MKREITIDKHGHKSSGKWGYVGEKDITHLMIELPDELLPCDFIKAKIISAGEEFTTDKLNFADGKVDVVIPLSCTVSAGKITVQIIGYVVDETDEIYSIGKTAVFAGVISPSSKGKPTTDTVQIPLLERIWVKIQALADKIHTHSNKELLDRITEDSLGAARVVYEYTVVKFSGSLRSDKYYVFTNPAIRIAILSFLHVGAADVVPEYIFEFKSGDTPTRLSLPRDYVWSNNDIPNIKENKKYIIRVIGNVASYTEVNI